jgi:two-component system, LytTR family, sensor kinase
MTKQRALRWAAITALWVLIGLALSTEVYFNMRVTMADVRFWYVAEAQFYRALFWALAAPLVLGLKSAIPLSAGRWIGGVSFHLVMSFLLMLGYYLLRILLAMVSEGDPLSEFWTMAKRSFYGRNLIDMAYYWAVIGIAYAMQIREKYQRETLRAAQLESKLIEAELKALKHQLNPHFLFNTMNTISVLVRDQRNDEAVQLIARLSSLLRMSLENTRVQTVTLRQELDFLTRYLEIQRARFGERLQFRADADQEALDAVIPNLILQPAVENAILHGVAQKTDAGIVEITARVREKRLELSVRDDGPGFSGKHDSTVKEGIGLTNTRVRLERHYGKDYQMVLKSEKGRGTTVNLVVPYRSATAVT